uniref:Uncharacterized protein n=1 Tax=Craspedostauros australis TaxID=1486917 RepID=A0A7R9WQK3_9STRA|mmetsp:Transcript_13676/g.37636  ORF Transcript_13676/g.37636 Transcript_13676/m.37636 type:complete len:140 (+) Transcript_13676:97-516(+)
MALLCAVAKAESPRLQNPPSFVQYHCDHPERGVSTGPPWSISHESGGSSSRTCWKNNIVQHSPQLLYIFIDFGGPDATQTFIVFLFDSTSVASGAALVVALFSQNADDAIAVFYGNLISHACLQRCASVSMHRIALHLF